MADDTGVVSVSGLRKIFGGGRSRGANGTGVVAVDDVSFSVPRGSSFGIVGESGSGKTTIARMLMGLETPTAGTVDICGARRPAGKLRSRERRAWARRIQIVFQDPYTSLDPHQRVRGCIEEVIALHSSQSGSGRRAAALEALGRVGLDESHANAYPSELSGGQRQRVAIARAMVAEPDVLILDEAVSALDVSIQAHVLNLLADIRESSSITYIFISHDLGVVRQITDSVMVMHKGRVVEQGTTGSVLDHPKHEYTQALRRSVPGPGWKPTRVSRA